MLFTDTGSLTYEIKSEDVYEEFFKQNHYILKIFEPVNEKVTGKMKDMSEGKIND